MTPTFAVWSRILSRSATDNLRMRAVPLDDAFQTLAQGDRRRIAEQPLRLPDIGDRMSNVAGSAGLVDGLDVDTEDRPDLSRELVQAGPDPAADVEDVAGRARMVGRAPVRVHDVRDVREVAALLAVAEDRGRPAGQQPGREAWDHGGVLRARVLARAEHVEVAERDCLGPVQLVEHPAVLLADRLAER